MRDRFLFERVRETARPSAPAARMEKGRADPESPVFGLVGSAEVDEAVDTVVSVDDEEELGVVGTVGFSSVGMVSVRVSWQIRQVKKIGRAHV